MIRFEDLLEQVKTYTSAEEREFLRRAYVFSALEHKGQVRHSGEPYLVHPLEVASILADMRLDPVAIAAALALPNGQVAPYTIDAAYDPTQPGGLPQGGESVVSFPNNHLMYALTWYGLGLVLAAVYIAFARGRLRGTADSKS